MSHLHIFVYFCLFLGLAGCSLSPAATSSPFDPTPAAAVLPASTPVPADTLAPDPATAPPIPATTSQPPSVAPSYTPAPGKATLAPEAWKELPVVPTISARTLEIYQQGLALGNQSQVFSKVGDCGSTPAWFLGDFDRKPGSYRLGPYTDLQPVIEYYAGSFSRKTLAGKAGFNASSVFSPLWADRTQCEANESPLACEIRINRPSLVFIMLGSNDVWHQENFEPQMRKMIEYLIERGIVPVLSTKADNDEGNGAINAKIADLALEYDIPLWNYWLAVQPLPDQGLQEDGVHITWAPNRFDDLQAMEKGWPVRNLTALQVLNAFWKAANPPTNPQS